MSIGAQPARRTRDPTSVRARVRVRLPGIGLHLSAAAASLVVATLVSGPAEPLNLPCPGAPRTTAIGYSYAERRTRTTSSTMPPGLVHRRCQLRGRLGGLPQRAQPPDTVRLPAVSLLIGPQIRVGRPSQAASRSIAALTG